MLRTILAALLAAFLLQVGLSGPAAALTPPQLRTIQQDSPCRGIYVQAAFAGNVATCWKGARLRDPTAIPGWSFVRNSPEICQWADGHLTQAGANTPCFTDLGVGIWESRTNIVPRNIDCTTWCGSIFGTVTITQGQADPMGGTGGAQLVGTGSWQVGSQTADVVGTTYTCSWWVKASVSTSFYVSVYDGVSGTNQSYTATPTWKQYSSTQTAATGSANMRCAIGSFSGSPTLLAAFPNLEPGAFPTTTILTSGSAATRAADIAKVTGLVAPAAYTVAGRALRYVNNPGVAAQAIIAFADAGHNNSTHLVFRNFANNFTVSVQSGGATTWSTDGGTELGLGVAQTVALSVGGTAVHVAANGAVILSNNAVTIPVSPTNLNLGTDGATGQPLNGYVQRVLLSPSAYSDAQLQALTR